jgi:hypothetical protein
VLRGEKGLLLQHIDEGRTELAFHVGRDADHARGAEPQQLQEKERHHGHHHLRLDFRYATTKYAAAFM